MAEATIDQRKPILLQQGFSPVLQVSGAAPIANEQYVARTDRGKLKYFDIIPGTLDRPELNQDVRASLSVGGEEILEEDLLGMWAPQAQFGKDKNWRLRAFAQDAQTIQFTLDGTNAVLEQQAILIASYTTKYHEEFLKKGGAKLNFGLGLKRRTFLLNVTAGAAGRTLSLEDIIPRNRGNVIGVGISNSYDLISANNELTNQFCTVSIDGVTIIENVPAAYYNIAVGRDLYFQPIQLNPGSTFKFDVATTGVSADDIYYALTFYFDN